MKSCLMKGMQLFTALLLVSCGGEELSVADLSPQEAALFAGEASGVDAKMVSGQKVMAGPISEYKQIGSVDPNETVRVLAHDESWFYIAYDAIGKGRRRGYVPKAEVQNHHNVERSVPDVVKTGAASYVPKGAKVYDGPSTQYYADGSLSPNEGVTVFNGEFNGFVEVEYGTAKGTRRGFVPKGALSGDRQGLAFEANAADVYSGPDGKYLDIGGVSQNEIVVVLEEDAGWYYVEYNKRAFNGRKRGYIQKAKIPGVYGVIAANYDSVHYANARTKLDVFTGPDDNYDPAGKIFAGERVTVFPRRERGYVFIEYDTNATSKSKRGFVPASQIDEHWEFAIPLPQSGEGIYHRETYGKSGRGLDLPYYQIGQGHAVAVVVCALHGFEDKWNRDGEELVHVCNRLIEDASARYRANPKSLNGWALYVIPAANPDGLLYGYTNNGPGRCTAGGYDLNRSFPTSFNPSGSKRNHTGSQPLEAPEASALYRFISGLKRSNPTDMVLYDVHGWEQRSYGNKRISEPFRRVFGLPHSDSYGGGFLITWARSQRIDAALLELPIPTSPADARARGFALKTANSILEYLENNSPKDPNPSVPHLGELALSVIGNTKVGTTVTIEVRCPSAHHLALHIVKSEDGIDTWKEFPGAHGSISYRLDRAGQYILEAAARNTATASDPGTEKKTTKRVIQVTPPNGQALWSHQQELQAIVDARGDLQKARQIIDRYYQRVQAQQNLLDKVIGSIDPLLQDIAKQSEYIKFQIAVALMLPFELDEGFLNKHTLIDADPSGDMNLKLHFCEQIRNARIKEGSFGKATILSNMIAEILHITSLEGVVEELLRIMREVATEEVIGSARQVVLGNYTDDVTLGGTTVQILLGIFDLDLPGDIRDITYDITHWEWSEKHGTQTTLDCIGLFPILGIVKYGDEVDGIIKATTKGIQPADEIAECAAIAGHTGKPYDTIKNAVDAADDIGLEPSLLKWGNPTSKPTYGHTFTDHTAKKMANQLIDRARSLGHQVGQWTDDKAAAAFIAEVAKRGPGVHHVELPGHIKGRSFLGDGTELAPDMARVVVKQDGSVRTAFPYDSRYPN